MPRRYARGKRRVPGSMNGLERDYANHLTLRQRAGEIEWFAYEAVKLRLADRTTYSPDFAVMHADGTLEMHETKGYMRDDANVKLKVAAEVFPFRFYLIYQRSSGWDIREV